MIDELRLRALPGLPEIRPGDDLPALLAAVVPRGPGVLVVAQKIVSKAEGRIVRLDDVEPSPRARELGLVVGRDPRHVELVLREAARVVRAVPGVLIAETRHGLVCANAGVDLSNAPESDGPGAEIAVLLPLDPDASAECIRARLGPGRAVIVSDTFGRPWREGLVDVAIGVAGLAPLRDMRGEPDRSGRVLQVTVMAQADQLAAAAGLLMEKAAGRPAVWIEGLHPSGSGRLADLIRDPSRDLFR
jgi:coenzyme F420-0:L-glutamate ligase/coenzyme F420-1:gamma-L-glutamate ligase